MSDVSGYLISAKVSYRDIMCETIPDSPFLFFVGARGKPVNEARVMETVSYLPPSIVINYYEFGRVIPCSKKFSLGANFRHFRPLRENRTRKKKEEKLMASFCAYVDTNLYPCEGNGFLQSV